jgi:hypothetical protein
MKTRSKVHISDEHHGYAACGARAYKILTNVRRGITCKACRRTRTYKRATAKTERRR